MSRLALPTVIVNFKAYTEVDGESALSLAQACATVAEETGVGIAVCPPMAELGSVARGVGLPVLSQHVEARKPGSATGWVTPSMVRASGAVGSLLNHSEHRMVLADLREAVRMCRLEDLVSVVCTDSAASSGAAAFFRPDFVAVEPPELIGGDVSVTTADPEVVSDTVDAVRSVDKDVKVLCGAGIKTGEDVRTAIGLGASGVLLASGVVKHKDPTSVLRDLVSGI